LINFENTENGKETVFRVLILVFPFWYLYVYNYFIYFSLKFITDVIGIVLVSFSPVVLYVILSIIFFIKYTFKKNLITAIIFFALYIPWIIILVFLSFFHGLN